MFVRLTLYLSFVIVLCTKWLVKLTHDQNTNLCLVQEVVEPKEANYPSLRQWWSATLKYCDLPIKKIGFTFDRIGDVTQ